jgi:hypothetical protein
MRETVMKSTSNVPTFSLATMSLAGMALFAVIDQAEAGKGIPANGSGTYKVGPIAGGGVSRLPRPPTTGTVKPKSPVGHGRPYCGVYKYNPECRIPPKPRPR